MEFFHAGSAIVLTGHPVPKTHLWLILTDPDPETDQVVAAMVVSRRAHTDRTVTLVAGDHSFITHESSVDYGGVKRLQIARLKAALKSGRCELTEDMKEGLLQRVRAGLFASPRTPHHMIDYCKERFPKAK